MTQEAFADAMRLVRSLARSSEPPDAVRLCLDLAAGCGPEDLQHAIGRLHGDERDFAIASAYTLLLPTGRRKALGAYLTPPHMVDHLLRRLTQHGVKAGVHAIHDPAAGGAAFIVPLLRRMISARELSASEHPEFVRELKSSLTGREIDPGLAQVANALVRSVLMEHGINVPADFELIECGDSLQGDQARFDAIIGNPPYGKVGAAGQKVWAPLFPDILGGQLNLYALFLRRALDCVSVGGLIGFIVPTSLLQGPEFTTLRSCLLKHTNLLGIDMIEKRTGAFMDVVQDTCFVVFRVGYFEGANHPVVPVASVGGDNRCIEIGTMTPCRSGAPWVLPTKGLTGHGGSVLADYGYRARVGYLVMNRQQDRIVKEPGPDRAALVRAASVTDGRLDLSRSGGLHVTIPTKAGYRVLTDCVVLQRTANRKQSRMLNAASVSGAEAERVGGLVGENHVIFLLPVGKPKVSPSVMATLLNSGPVNERWRAMSGTASVSTKLLAGLDLPHPLLMRKLPDRADRIIANAYQNIQKAA